MFDNDNWLYQGTEDAWLHYTYSERSLEAPTTPNKVDNDQSSTETLEEVLDTRKQYVEGLSYDKRFKTRNII